MTKQQITIEVDVPEGWEVSSVPFARLCENVNMWTLESGKPAQGNLSLLVEVQRTWQWPASLAANWVWISMNADGRWYFSRAEPWLGDDDVWHSLGGYADASAFVDFTPPPCTDWRQSKRRRPT